MLHVCRQDLATLRVEFPDIVLAATDAKAQALKKFLMDTYQLLMSSISVLDSETEIQQVYRGQKLTQLAFVYVPLSFVTSIFGMNVRGFNGLLLSIWVCIPVLAIAIACTAEIFKLYDMREDSKRRHRGPIDNLSRPITTRFRGPGKGEQGV